MFYSDYEPGETCWDKKLYEIHLYICELLGCRIKFLKSIEQFEPTEKIPSSKFNGE